MTQGPREIAQSFFVRTTTERYSQGKPKVACRVQVWKKSFCQNSDKIGYSFIKNDMFMYLLCIYKELIILSLLKVDKLNFTMYILTILACPLKT